MLRVGDSSLRPAHSGHTAPYWQLVEPQEACTHVFSRPGPKDTSIPPRLGN